MVVLGRLAGPDERNTQAKEEDLEAHGQRIPLPARTVKAGASRQRQAPVVPPIMPVLHVVPVGHMGPTPAIVLQSWRHVIATQLLPATQFSGLVQACPLAVVPGGRQTEVPLPG